MTAPNEPRTPPRVRRALWGAERWPLLLVLLVLFALGWWRVALVRQGWDPDTDAYGHHAIARELLLRPWHHGAHWVWLPLFHWVQALGIWAFGLDLNGVRLANVVIWALTPLALFALLVDPRAGMKVAAPLAAFAAVLMALSPIGMQMGTTGQTEPVFALLLVLYGWAMDRRAHVAAALALGAAVLARYEAWAVLALSGVWVVAQTGRALWRRERVRWSAWLPILFAAALIVTWAWVRLPFDGGRWFGFVADTRAFASGALKSQSSLDGGVSRLLSDLTYYGWTVALRVQGIGIVLAPLGAWRLTRLRPWFALTGFATLAFVTQSWVLRSSLGLDRHFVALLAPYAAASALGAWSVAEWTIGPGPLALRLRSALTLLLCVVSLSNCWFRLGPWMRDWGNAISGGFPDRVAVGRYLASLPGEPKLFCDEPTVEIMSGLPHWRFHREALGSPGTRDLVRREVTRRGEAVVVGWWSPLDPYKDGSDVLFRPDGESEWRLAVLRARRVR